MANWSMIGKTALKGMMGFCSACAIVGQLGQVVDMCTGYSKKKAETQLNNIVSAKVKEEVNTQMNVKTQQEVETQ